MNFVHKIVVVAALSISSASAAISAADFEAKTTFYGFNGNSTSQRFVSTFASSIADQGCDLGGNFSIIVHGWQEGIVTPWVNITVNYLLKYRGGCVFFMDYSKYANVSDYSQLATKEIFDGLSALLVRKLQQIGNYDRLYGFGFSFGSRLLPDAGTKLGNQLVDRMDLCDPAGPMYPGFVATTDPKPAAKNVACINTSTDKGTTTYNCHQNFRMGVCGSYQIGASSYPIGSHGLCPYFFNLAFTWDFVPVNTNGCTSVRLAPNQTSSVKMGYMGDFNRTLVRGDIFISTARYPPYIIKNQVTENLFDNLLGYFRGYQQ